MADTKTTKKDLEEQAEAQASSIEILEGSNATLMQQTDEYWNSLMNEQTRNEKLARYIGEKDAQISELQFILRQAQFGLEVAEDLNERLEALLNSRNAQQNFILRVVHAISIYGGDNIQVIRGLAESLLEDAEEIEVPA